MPRTRFRGARLDGNTTIQPDPLGVEKPASTSAARRCSPTAHGGTSSWKPPTPEQIAPLRAEFDTVGWRVSEAQKAGVASSCRTVATSRSGWVFWMGLLVGQVKEGFLADLLVVDGDPSADVSVLQDRSRIRAILKGGRFVKDTL